MQTHLDSQPARLILERAQELVRATLDLILPPRCPACSVILHPGELFCEVCESALEPIVVACPRCGVPAAHPAPCASCLRSPPPFEAARALLIYGGPLASALQRVKYSAASQGCHPLGRLLGGALRPEEVSCELLVPVPLHPRRLRERGYNQAALLARALLARAPAPRPRLELRALARCRATASQAGLEREARLQNVRGAFRADPARVAGRSVLLLDDVLTTGATAAACAEALLEAGARRVRVLALARAALARAAP